MDAPHEDYKQLDHELKRVESSLRSLSESKELTEPVIERWRWDSPSVSLQWIAPDFISRSINAYFHDEEPRAMNIEANAWHDVDRPRGAKRVRYWRHQAFGSLNLPLNPQALNELLDRAYRDVVAWKHDILNKTELTAWPQ